MARVHKLGFSKPLKEEYRVNWKIANFSEIRGSEEALQAETYRFEMGSTIKLPTPLKLKCYLTCNLVGGRIWINPNVALDETPSGNVSKLFATLQVEVNEGSVFCSDTSPMSNILTDSMRYSPFLPLVRGDPNYANYINSDGSLYLTLIVTLYNLQYNLTLANVSLHGSQLEFEFKSREKLQQDLSKLLTNPSTLSHNLRMTKVVSSDNKEFFVNPNILAVRCPVLYDMLAEETSPILKFSDISGQHLETLLGFVHTATLPVNWKKSNEIGDELVYVAQKFGLMDLVEFLEECRRFCKF